LSAGGLPLLSSHVLVASWVAAVFCGVVRGRFVTEIAAAHSTSALLDKLTTN
jgi:hypothetical protein